MRPVMPGPKVLDSLGMVGSIDPPTEVLGLRTTRQVVNSVDPSAADVAEPGSVAG